MILLFGALVTLQLTLILVTAWQVIRLNRATLRLVESVRLIEVTPPIYGSWVSGAPCVRCRYCHNNLTEMVRGSKGV